MSARPHACGTHVAYRLSCHDFDALRESAAGRCQRCAVEADLLVIDHDHAGGRSAVRGLVCSRCNARLARVDALREARDDLDDAYLARAWHRGRRVTYVPEPPADIRGVRVDTPLWKAAQGKASRNREPLASVIRRALVDYVGDDLPDPDDP